MSSLGTLPNQYFVDPLAKPSESIRAGELLAVWARKLLASGDYSARQRQQLHDLTRAVRMTAADRSGLSVILELAPFSALSAATWGPEIMRTEIIGRGKYRLPCPDEAHDWEEESNRSGNIAARRHRERRTRSTFLDLTEAMHVQAISSHIVSAAEASDFLGR